MFVNFTYQPDLIALDPLRAWVNVLGQRPEVLGARDVEHNTTGVMMRWEGGHYLVPTGEDGVTSLTIPALMIQATGPTTQAVVRHLHRELVRDGKAHNLTYQP